MNNKKLILPLLALCVGLPLHAQEEDKSTLLRRCTAPYAESMNIRRKKETDIFKLETRVSVLKEKWQKLLNIKQKSTCRMKADKDAWCIYKNQAC